MNPPTTGHMKLINKLHQVADKLGTTHSLAVSHSQDAKRNPLTPDQKIKHIKRYSPDTNVIASSKETPNILNHATNLYKKGVTDLHIVAGSDRKEELHKLLNDYNDKQSKHGHYKFKSITVHSSGERDADSEGAEGMSATKMRDHARNNNFSAFRKGVPSHVSDKDAKDLMKDVINGQKLNEELETKAFNDLFNEELEELEELETKAFNDLFEQTIDEVEVPNAMETIMDYNAEFEKLITEEVSVRDLAGMVNDLDVKDLDPHPDDADVLHAISPEHCEDEEVEIDDARKSAAVEEGRVLSVQQRMALSQRMRRNAHRYAILRKLKNQRMAPSDRLRYRSRKAAIMALRRKFSGDKAYSELSSQQRIMIDKSLNARFGKNLVNVVNKLSQKLLPMVRKKELGRFTHIKHVQEQDVSKLASDISKIPNINIPGYSASLKSANTEPKPLPLYNRTRYGEIRKLYIAKEDVTNSQVESNRIVRGLEKKSVRSGIDFNTIREVYLRGIEDYNNNPRETCEADQWAFARVNSFIANGAAAKLDEDLANEVVRATDYEMKKVKLSNDKVVWRKVRKVIDEAKSPLDKLKDFDKSRVASGKKPIFKEQDVMVKEEGGAGYMGTDDLRKKYTNDTPGQTDTINVAHYSAPKPWEIDKPHNEGKSPKTYLDIWNTLSGRRKLMAIDELSPAQKAIDKNKNDKIDGSDLAHLRSKKKQPQGAYFAAQRRKERLASNGRMDENIELDTANELTKEEGITK